MTKIKFDKANKKRFGKASRTQIEDYFVSLSPDARTVEWLDRSNRYRVKCTSKYWDDLAAKTVSEPNLIAYIAGSGPTHVIDAWSYLGRAVDATLRGDTYSAIHFGYYAELRAAMALLACEGVGILNKTHPIVPTSGPTDPMLAAQLWNRNGKKFDSNRKLGTHLMVWLALRHWSTLKRAGDLLEELILPESISLTDWFSACGIAAPAREIARKWLRSWGIDLALFDDDHDSRNLASYRPSQFRLPDALDPLIVTTFVEELWSLFEPSLGRRFPKLERFLLRAVVRKSGVPNPSAVNLETLGLSAAVAADWANFFSGTDDPMPLRLADQAKPLDHPDCHLQIISRTALLLSIATLAARRLLVNAGYSATTVEFWWNRYGATRGLWEVTPTAPDPFELWADIELSLTNSQAWRATAVAPSLRSWRAANPQAAHDFGGMELAGIWGLIP